MSRTLGAPRRPTTRVGVLAVIGAAILALVPPPPLSAQVISNIVFLPQTYFVGDLVEARVVLRSTGPLELRVPETLPTTEWIDVRGVTIIQRADGYEVRVQFQPFFLGTRQLPPIDLGSMQLSGISAVVSNLVEPGQQLELEPIRGQLLLPGTRLLIGLLIALAIAIPTVVIVAGGWGRRTLAAITRRWRERRPYRATMRSLRQLQAELHELDGRSYYIRLLDIARDYFDGRFDARLRSATTGELDRRLQRVHITAEARRDLIELFQFGDLVKFANHRVSVDDRTRHLESLRHVVALVQHPEQQEATRVGA